MNRYIDIRDTSPERMAACEGGQEHHFTEGAVMIAFAMYLFDRGAVVVELHPDGEHLKRHDMRVTLEHLGFEFRSVMGVKAACGNYRRDGQTLKVTAQSGLGDVVTSIDGVRMVAECKGGCH